MSLKRRAVAPPLNELPLTPTHTSGRILRSSTRAEETTSPLTTPRRNLRTYGNHKANQSDSPLKINTKKKDIGATEEIGSEDELDTLSQISRQGSNLLLVSPSSSKRLRRQRASINDVSKQQPTFNAGYLLSTTQGKLRESGSIKSQLLTMNLGDDQRPLEGADSLRTTPRKAKRAAQKSPEKSLKKQKIMVSEATPTRASTERPLNVDSTRSPLTSSVASSGVQPRIGSTPDALTNTALTNPISQPKKSTIVSIPSRLSSHTLPQHLHQCLNAQKRAILRALDQISDATCLDDDSIDNDIEPSTNSAAIEQLTSLLHGTITRGEGNSCLILGPRGSGKSRLAEKCLSQISGEAPFIIRLSGWTQYNDRLAMREIAYQLGQLTGTSFLDPINDASRDADKVDFEDVNPFWDGPATSKISLPPSSHLPALISILPTLQRPTIIILDGFDLFALHPRQFLLYCLLDAVQSCSASSGGHGLAVIGLTSRFDTISMLEKRVKSRFSGRMIRTASPRTIRSWEKIIRTVLYSNISDLVTTQCDDNTLAEWHALWIDVVDSFIGDQVVQTAWNESFGVARDIRMLNRMLLSVVLHLSPSLPFLSPAHLTSAAIAQRTRPRFPLLHTLSYPSICLLIASVHADTAGHPTFTFEMLHERFRDQVRASSSAPVQVNGGSIGMVRCSRQMLMSAFENLISTQVFIPVAAYVPSIAKEFVRYRSCIERGEIRKAVDRANQVNLKKWLTKGT